MVPSRPRPRRSRETLTTRFSAVEGPTPLSTERLCHRASRDSLSPRSGSSCLGTTLAFDGEENLTKRIRFNEDQLNSIFDRTRGKCHVCHKQLSFSNYGRHGRRAAWQVDHSVALANGGSHHPNNLFPACIPCNLDKSTRHSRTARRAQGKSKAPLNRSRHEAARAENIAGGGAAGFGVGALFGPAGALIGGAIGLLVGDSINPDLS